MPRKRRSPFDDFWDDDWFGSFFRDVMRRMERDIQRMFKHFRELERAPDTALGPNVSGFSIRIVSDGRRPPRVEVQRFGPQPTAGLRPLEPERPATQPPRTAKPARPGPERFEEAPYTYHLDVRAATVELQIPGVEDPSNVELNFQPESLEIRVYPPRSDKAYFAILKIPPNVIRDRSEIRVEKDRVIITIPRKHALAEG